MENYILNNLDKFNNMDKLYKLTIIDTYDYNDGRNDPPSNYENYGYT